MSNNKYDDSTFEKREAYRHPYSWKEVNPHPPRDYEDEDYWNSLEFPKSEGAPIQYDLPKDPNKEPTHKFGDAPLKEEGKSYKPWGEEETVCEEAQRIVYGDREKTYDHPSRNFERTAHLWNGYLEAKYPDRLCLDNDDVAWMMALLKLAREIHLHKRDNVVDFIGYAACVQKMRDYND